MSQPAARPVLPRRVMPPDPALSAALRLLSARLACREPEAVAYVRGHLERATTLSEAAVALGCSLRTASRWAAELGVRRPRGGYRGA